MNDGNAARPLATVERQPYDQRPAQRIQIERAEFNGHRFTRLAVWEQGSNGTWYPTRRIVTIRDRELALVVSALNESRRLADQERGPAEPEDDREPAWLSEHYQRQRARGRDVPPRGDGGST